jgi:hypothetical protein
MTSYPKFQNLSIGTDIGVIGWFIEKIMVSKLSRAHRLIPILFLRPAVDAVFKSILTGIALISFAELGIGDLSV